MSKIKLLGIAVIGLLLLNLAMICFMFLHRPSQRRPIQPGMQKNGPRDIIIHRLKFDKDQITAYNKLIEVHKTRIKELNDSIFTFKNQLYASLSDTSSAHPDDMISRINILQKKIETTHFNHFLDIRKLCNPDQLPAFEELSKDLSLYFSSPRKEPKQE